MTQTSGGKFNIFRSGDTNVAETVRYRTVGLSAYAGQHFTALSDEITFAAGVTNKLIAVVETSPGADVFRFQTASTRSYRFEVLSRQGAVLAYVDRNETSGASVPSSGLYSEKSATIDSSEFTVTPKGYIQDCNPRTFNSSSFYTDAANSYLKFLNAQLRMTLAFQAKEEDDAYQYFQLLVDNTTGCDSATSAKKGDPGTPSLSRYMAGFEIYSGSTYSTYKNYTFPILSVGNNDAKVTDAWGYGDKFNLVKQKFNTNCRATDGKILIPPGFSTLSVRFDSSGSENSDKWQVKNINAKIQAYDLTYPTLLNGNTTGIVLNPGPHYKGSTFYISVPFSEIVYSAGAPKRLSTTWGDADYAYGDGSNVLTFRGTITADDGTELAITGYNGQVRDLANNHYQYSGTGANTTWNKTFYGTLVETPPWAGRGTADDPYVITTTYQLDKLASDVNTDVSDYDNTYFELGADIAYAHDSSSTWSNPGNASNFSPIGGYAHSFNGIFDGKGHTVSGIRIHKTGTTEDNGDSSLGLFGYNGKTVRNVILADAAITGFKYCGGIAGYSSGLVENCEVRSNVGIYCVATNAQCHGGVVGSLSANLGKISGCTSAATVKRKSGDPDGACKFAGGIAGSQSGGSITNCIAVGAVVSNATSAGAIVGSGSSGLVANYYRNCTVDGVSLDVGTAAGDVDGARSVHALDLADGISVVSAETVRINNVTYYAAATPVKLGNTPPDGQRLALYRLDGISFLGDTFEMPSGNAAVTALWVAAMAGEGTSANPYRVSSADELDALATIVNNGVTNYSGACFLQTADIVYDGTTNNYTPVGATYGNYFGGNYDGGGYGVSGINITRTGDGGEDKYVGIFGCIGNGGCVQGVVVSNSVFTGYNCVGGIAGYIENGIISNCCAKSSVTVGAGHDSARNVGGIAGFSFGDIVGCASAAILTTFGHDNCVSFGGVVGAANSSLVGDCFYAGGCFEGGPIVGSMTSSAFSRNYYTGTNWVGVGGGVSAYKLNPGEDIVFVGGEETYDVSGMAFIGGNVLRHVDGAATNFYCEAYKTASVSYVGAIPENYLLSVVCDDGTTARAIPPEGCVYSFSMPKSDAAVYARFTPDPSVFWGEDRDGSAERPYVITNDVGLCLLSSEVNSGNRFEGKFFELGADIDMSGVADFSPIGTLRWSGAIHLAEYHGVSFRGNFNGNGRAIVGLSIECDDLLASGLFGVLYNGSVSNLVLDSYSLVGGEYLGGIAGAACNATIKNCFLVNSAIASIGDMEEDETFSIVDSCSGCVIESNYFSGCTRYRSDEKAEELFAIRFGSSVTASPAGIVTYKDSGYYRANTEVTLGHADVAPEGYRAPFLGYSLNLRPLEGDTFTMSASNVLATARWTVAEWDGSGTEEDPYMIYHPSQLDLLAARVNGGDNCEYQYFKLGADIAYDPTALDENGENYTAIGGYFDDVARKFSGNFNGDGHTVSGIRTNKTGDGEKGYYQGLFGYVDHGTVRSISLSNCVFVGNMYVGGIVGRQDCGTTVNCRVDGSVVIGGADNESLSHGGIVGADHEGAVYGSLSAATIVNQYFNGGIVGYSLNGSVRDCLSLGSLISAEMYVGAVMGCNTASPDDLPCTNNYYAACTVNGTNNATNVGCGSPGGDQDGARLAHAIALGGEFRFVGEETVYDVSGLAAIGDSVLAYADGAKTNFYSGAGQRVSFVYVGDGETAGQKLFVRYNDGTDHFIQSENGVYSFTMPDGDVAVTAQWMSCWEWLQAAINMADGATIALDRDFVATESDVTLEVADSVTLDLNGHNVDAGGHFGVVNILPDGHLVLTNSVHESGAVKGGYAENGGGVYVNAGGALTMSGGAISGNCAENQGGGVYVCGGTFTMSGGTISGNCAENQGGGVSIGPGGSFGVSGSPVVSGNTANHGEANNVDLKNGQFIAVGDLTDGASIGVTTETKPVSSCLIGFAEAASADDGRRFFSDIIFYGVVVDDGELCLQLLTPWKLLQARLDAGGAVVLEESVTAETNDAPLRVTKSVTLDLAGHTISGSPYANVVIVDGGGNLFLTNSVDGAGAISGGNRGVSVEAGGTFTMAGGEISGNKIIYNYECGGGVYLCDGGVFTMTGGRIADNTNASSGGGVYMAGGTFTMSGGAITGNSAHNGGGVYIGGVVEKNCSFTMSGGEIAENFGAHGGGVYVSTFAFFTMTGGAIISNATYAGGIWVDYVEEYGNFTVSGSPVISGNTNNLGQADNAYLLHNCRIAVSNLSAAASIGVNVQPTVTTNGVRITKGAAPGDVLRFFSDKSTCFVREKNGEAYISTIAPTPWEIMQYRLDAGGVVALSESVFAETNDVPLKVRNSVTLDLAGFALSGNWKTNVLVVAGGGSLTLTNSVPETGVISNGYAWTGGGVSVCGGGTFTMSGGMIAKNYSGFRGGGVYVDYDGIFTMTGGSITNNSGTGGGGVYVYGGTFTMTAGAICDNDSSYGGGAGVNVREGTFTMSAGTISGNSTYTCEGGGVYVNADGTFKMTGGEISGNVCDDGGGVYVDENARLFAVSGDSVISGNLDWHREKPNDVHLYRGKTIAVSNLTDGASIGVRTMILPANGIPVTVTSGASAGDARYFFSDRPEYLVGKTANGEVCLACAVTTFPEYLDGATEDVKTNWVGWAICYGANTNAEYEGHFLLNLDPAMETPEGSALLKVVEFSVTTKGFHLELGSDVPGYRFTQPDLDDPTMLGNGYATLELATDPAAFASTQTLKPSNTQTLPQLVTMPIPVAIDAATGRATVDFDLSEFLALLYPEAPEEWRDKVNMPSPLFLRPTITTTYPDDYTDFIYFIVAEP